MAFSFRFRVRPHASGYLDKEPPLAALERALKGAINEGLPSAYAWLRQNVTWLEEDQK